MKTGPECVSDRNGRMRKCVGFSKLAEDCGEGMAHVFYVEGKGLRPAKSSTVSEVNLGVNSVPMDISGGSLDGFTHKELPFAPRVLRMTSFDKQPEGIIFKGTPDKSNTS